MLLYELIELLGLREVFLRTASRFPAHVQHRLGLVPVRVPARR